MTVRECYEEMGADYEEVLRRLANEERVARFLLKFSCDESFDGLVKAVEESDYEVAFRAAHTLKGICLNLSITRLAESSSALTESLRAGGWSEEAGPLFERVKDDYSQTIQAIQRLKND